LDPSPTRDDPINVLHVDDEEDQIAFTKLFLEQADPSIRVTHECDPDRILDLIGGGGFDCLVTDYKMPVLNGVELATRVRRVSDIYIIIYTGHGSEDVAGAAFAAGVNDYLRKELDPCHYSVLARRIRGGVENQRAKRKNRDWERELSWMADNSSDAIFRIELDKGITRCNPAFRALYGEPVDGTIPFEDIIPARISREEYARFQAEAREAMGKGSREIKLTHRWKTGDGRDLWFETNLSPVLDNGRLVGFEALAREITGRVRAEEELRESRQRLANFIESATDMIIITDRDLRIMEVNDRMLGFWGRTRGQVVGRSLLEVEPDLEGEERLVKFREVIETGEPYTYHDIVPHSADESRHIALRLFRVGEGLGLISSDITEASRLGRELEEKDRSLQLLVDYMPDTFYICDGRGGMVFVSPNVSRMAGYSSEEVTKPDPGFWRSLIYHEDRGKVAAALEAYMGGGAPYDVEYRVQRRDGSLIWVRDRATQRYEMEGTTYFDGKLTDVTEQKLVERGLMGYTQRLEQMVRDLKVYSRQLEDTVNERNRLLIDAERTIAVGQVASMVGHDLRGPLQSISNAVYLLQRSPEKSGELLNTIKGSVQYAVRILEDLRNATKDAPIDTETVDVAEIVRLALGDAHPQPGVELRSELGYGECLALVDPVKIRRVMDNLVRNACEAITGTGTVTVKARREAGGLVVEVQDTGVGIPEEFRPNLFKTFKTTKRRGLGLGLAYCRRAVEAHGGSIEVASEVGVGTTFTVRIPQPRDEPDPGVTGSPEAAEHQKKMESTGS